MSKEEGGTHVFCSEIRNIRNIANHQCRLDLLQARNVRYVADHPNHRFFDAKPRTLSRHAAAGECKGLMRLVALSDCQTSIVKASPQLDREPGCQPPSLQQGST